MFEHYFPGIEVGKLTLDNFYERVKLVKKLLGQTDAPKDGAGLDPDEWYAAAMAGEIEPEVVKPLSDTEQKELTLKKLGLI